MIIFNQHSNKKSKDDADRLNTNAMEGFEKILEISRMGLIGCSALVKMILLVYSKDCLSVANINRCVLRWRGVRRKT
jgi:hypothetical protein